MRASQIFSLTSISDPEGPAGLRRAWRIGNSICRICEIDPSDFLQIRQRPVIHVFFQSLIQITLRPYTPVSPVLRCV